MDIVYNGAPAETPPETTLLQYLDKKELTSGSGIAVAVNETVIPRKNWPDTILKHGDSILVIKATQGG